MTSLVSRSFDWRRNCDGVGYLRTAGSSSLSGLRRDVVRLLAHALQRFLKHRKPFLELLIGHGKGHQHADHIPVRPRRENQQSMLVAKFDDLLRFLFRGLAGFTYQFDGL